MWEETHFSAVFNRKQPLLMSLSQTVFITLFICEPEKILVSKNECGRIYADFVLHFFLFSELGKFENSKVSFSHSILIDMTNKLYMK